MEAFKVRTVLLAVALALSATPLCAQKAVSNVHDFGVILLSAKMEYTFEFHNDRSEILEIRDVQLTPPLVVTRMPSRVQPGADGRITVNLREPRRKGEFKGSVVVNFANPSAAPLTFWATGRLVPPVDFDPFPAFFVSTQRGVKKTASLDIVNHEIEPLQIPNVIHDSSRFTTELETLQRGRRYRLSLVLNADAPAGQENKIITLQTSSRDHPTLQVKANVKVNERVYTFPTEIGLEVNTILLKVRPDLVASLSQELTVYQTGGTDFQIFSAQTDVPFLRLTPYQAQLKDRFGIKVDIIPEKLKAGEIKGSIIIVTNDAEFPQLNVPVTAVVEGGWQ